MNYNGDGRQWVIKNMAMNDRIYYITPQIRSPSSICQKCATKIARFLRTDSIYDDKVKKFGGGWGDGFCKAGERVGKAMAGPVLKGETVHLESFKSVKWKGLQWEANRSMAMNRPEDFQNKLLLWNSYIQSKRELGDRFLSYYNSTV